MKQFLHPIFSYRITGGEFLVTLSSVGNPDYRQDSDRPLPGVPNLVAHVNTVEEASQICRKYINYYELGSGNWSGGEIVRRDGLVVGRVSYNGRIWQRVLRPKRWTISHHEIHHPAFNLVLRPHGSASDRGLLLGRKAQHRVRR